MADNQPPQPSYLQKDKKGGFWANLGLFPKIIMFFGLVLIVTSLIFGLNLGDIPAFIINMAKVGVGVFLILIALQGAMAIMQPKAFSPTEDFRTKLINHAQKIKPPNAYNLWLRGEGRRSRALYGKILGVAWVPYLTSEVERDEEGHIIHLEDNEGKPILDKKSKQPIAKRRMIASKDGDTIFVVRKGLLGKPEIIRCNPKWHSEIIGDIYINDLGLVPFGEYFYPSKQWQSSILEILKQNEMETILTTFTNNLDLISNVTTLSIASEPAFRKLMEMRNETIISPMASAYPQQQYR